jgi:hypothetical protein
MHHSGSATSVAMMPQEPAQNGHLLARRGALCGELDKSIAGRRRQALWIEHKAVRIADHRRIETLIATEADRHCLDIVFDIARQPSAAKAAGIVRVDDYDKEHERDDADNERR